MWDATAFTQQGTDLYLFIFLRDTYTQVEKGKFVQVKSLDDLILLAGGRDMTLRSPERSSSD